MENVVDDDLGKISRAEFIPWDLLRNKKLLVTGGTGLIGSTLIKALLFADKAKHLGLQVLALVRDPNKARRMLGKESEQLHFLIGNVEQLPEISGDVDYIIHGASPTASLFFVEHPVETIRIAVEGTSKLLELARQKRVTGFIYLSSMEVYGAPHDDALIPESQGCTLDAMAVRSCYPIAKRLCENLCASYANEYGLPAKVVRLAQTFGPGVEKGDKRVFAEFARDAINGTDIVLQTAGTSKRMYLYTADAVSAILLVLLKGKAGEAYNAGNPATYCSIGEMAHMVAREIGGNCIKVRISSKTDDVNRKFFPPHHLNLDIHKLLQLGWRSDITLKEMYLRMMDGMK